MEHGKEDLGVPRVRPVADAFRAETKNSVEYAQLAEILLSGSDPLRGDRPGEIREDSDGSDGSEGSGILDASGVSDTSPKKCCVVIARSPIKRGVVTASRGRSVHLLA